jgi:hypothetical protein
MQENVKAVAGAVRTGESLSAAIGQGGIFPPIAAQLAAVGERSGDMPRQLDGRGKPVSSCSHSGWSRKSSWKMWSVSKRDESKTGSSIQARVKRVDVKDSVSSFPRVSRQNFRLPDGGKGGYPYAVTPRWKGNRVGMTVTIPPTSGRSGERATGPFLLLASGPSSGNVVSVIIA